MRAINRMVIHATATDPSASVKAILSYWRETLEWEFPGYHTLIQANGTHAQLLDYRKVSNGVRGYNSDSIHIAYIGGKDGVDTRTVEQVATLAEFVKWFAATWPGKPIVGHRDLSPDVDGNGEVDPGEWIKDCPCFDVRTFVNEVLA